MPPSLFVTGTDSLGEQIQREFPETKVVKALNTVNRDVMVDPARVPGDHDVFICGDDEAAKAQVRDLLGSFGWPAGSIIDLGDISTARGTEGHLLLWLRLWGVLGTGDFKHQGRELARKQLEVRVARLQVERRTACHPRESRPAGRGGLQDVSVMDHCFQIDRMFAVDDPILEAHTTLGF